MALFKFLNGKGRYHDRDARADLVEYITNPSKTVHGYVGGTNVSQEDIVGSMEDVAQRFGKTNGVQLRHFILSFYPQEVHDPQVVYHIGQEIMLFVGQEYQAIFAVHENTDNLHIHFMLNSVSYVDGRRYYGTRRDYHTLLGGLRKILWRYNIDELIPVTYRSGQDIQD